MQDPHSVMLKETFTEFSKNHHELIKFLSDLYVSSVDLEQKGAVVYLKLKLWMNDINQIKHEFLTAHPAFANLESLINSNIYFPYFSPPKGMEPDWRKPETIKDLISDLRTTLYALQRSVADLIKTWDLAYLTKQFEIRQASKQPRPPIAPQASAQPKSQAFFPVPENSGPTKKV